MSLLLAPSCGLRGCVGFGIPPHSCWEQYIIEFGLVAQLVHYEAELVEAACEASQWWRMCTGLVEYDNGGGVRQ